MTTKLIRYLITLFLFFLIFAFNTQSASAQDQNCLSMGADGMSLRNVTIEVEDATDGNYDFDTSFVISGEINCIPSSPGTSPNDTPSLIRAVSLEPILDRSLDPDILTLGPSAPLESNDGYFSFRPIKRKLDPYVDLISDTSDKKTWYLFFIRDTRDHIKLPISLSTTPLPPNITLIDSSAIKIILNPTAENPEDIPPSKLILTCGESVGISDPDNCPSNKPCCPSNCPITYIDNSPFCGYDGSVLISPEPTPIPPLQPCQTVSGKTPENCNTALGIISSDPGGFLTSMLGILMSVSGMLALYFIVRSGYQLMMSRGNPEAIQEARERLTSAIVGLLLIIFSLVIMSVIGVDLLKIPGFGS